MKPRLLMVGLFLATLAASANPFSAQAQEACYDADGTVIPCPAPEEEQDGGNKRPTVTPIPPTATATPLPITGPAEDGGTAKAEWSGFCKFGGNAGECIVSLINACTNAGGSYTKDSPEDGSGVTVKCTVPLVIEPTPLPVAGGDEQGATEAKWTGSCSGDNQTWKKCVNGLMNACSNSGGDAEIVEDDGATTTISCTIPDGAVVEPTPRPLAAPEDHWIGTCTEAAGNLSECIAEFQRQCPDGLLVVKVDIYADVYNFYCIPHENNPLTEFPLAAPPDPGSDDNWVGGCYGDDIDGCLNDMKAACDEEGGEYSEWYDEDGAGVYCQNASEGTPANPQPGGVPGSLPDLGLGAVIGIVAAVAIPAFMKNARKARIDKLPTNLGIPGEDPSARKPKPKPKPQPKPSGGGGSDYLLELDGVKGESKDLPPAPNTDDDILLDKGSGGASGPKGPGYDIKANQKM